MCPTSFHLPDRRSVRPRNSSARSTRRKPGTIVLLRGKRIGSGIGKWFFHRLFPQSPEVNAERLHQTRGSEKLFETERWDCRMIWEHPHCPRRCMVLDSQVLESIWETIFHLILSQGKWRPGVPLYEIPILGMRFSSHPEKQYSETCE